MPLPQAAAFVEQQGKRFAFANYLQLQRVAVEELLAEHALGSTDYADPIITTWTTATSKVNPAARDIPRLCSFFSSTQHS